MHHALLPQSAPDDNDMPTAATGLRQRRSLPRMPALPQRIRGGANEEVTAIAGGAGCCCCIIFVFVFLFTASVGPNEYGLLVNGMSGQLNGAVVRGGLHGRAPWQNYVTFPATQVTLVWAKPGADWTADSDRIQARAVQQANSDASTTDDDQDSQASGQSLFISCALQFKIIQDDLKEVYVKYKSFAKHKARILYVAKTTIIGRAQVYSPQDFWGKRDVIAADMLSQLDDALSKYWVKAVYFEILKIDFSSQFEASLVTSQVEKQKTIVNTYIQQVTKVMKSINVLNSANEAKIKNITAGAQKKSKETLANATQGAFNKKQHMKATMYKQIKTKLGFSKDQMKEYIKMKALLSQSGSGPVVINVPQPEKN